MTRDISTDDGFANTGLGVASFARYNLICFNLACQGFLSYVEYFLTSQKVFGIEYSTRDMEYKPGLKLQCNKNWRGS